jgi:hypothetical protein
LRAPNDLLTLSSSSATPWRRGGGADVHGAFARQCTGIE